MDKTVILSDADNLRVEAVVCYVVDDSKLSFYPNGAPMSAAEMANAFGNRMIIDTGDTYFVPVQAYEEDDYFTVCVCVGQGVTEYHSAEYPDAN